ncbi:SET domain-containing protein SmydA-8 [Drosophila pseudoobscura]|uniref:SET domain-containing protein SmydA-8 n=1 Tax=Drosophila pseudoobscura pseudoobscura TaxID=46245 RepID=A0A6I8UBL0_DROPS|nr:SET domain-containing protein SmydA-8 [Drosophila pseudoobscura]
MSSSLTSCALCQAKASQLCAACRSVVYCSREHQKEHWKQGHKRECKCYEVATNETLGRHLRATRDVKIGEEILREAPLLLGPKVASAPICLGCHRNLLAPQKQRGNYYKCSSCSWPLCGRECEESPHHRAECQLMSGSNFQSKINYTPGEDERKESAYCVIMLLRCMQLKASDPEGFARLSALEDHLEERLATPLYQVLRANLITFIKTILGMRDWSEVDILRIAAILDTNTFELRQPRERRKVRALFPGAAMISHDCAPNMRHRFDDDMNIIFLAKRPIAKGEILSISYTQPLRSTIQRRLHLRQAKCFDCACARCQDPTELGTFAGAQTCVKCKAGKIISVNPLQNTANWKCQLCNLKRSAKEVLLSDAKLQQEIEALDKTTPVDFEDFIYRHRVELHETNTHVLQAKYALTQLYGNAPGFTMDELSEESLSRKVDLCEELLKLANIFDGGWSIFRGNLLIDLEEALVAQALRVEEDPVECAEKLKQASELLVEIGNIMKHEPEMQQLLAERQEILNRALERFEEVKECE